VDKREFKIAEPVDIKVEASFSENVSAVIPIPVDSLGQFEVINVTAGETRTEGARTLQSWTYRVMTIDTGNVFVTPIQFAFQMKGDTTRRVASSNPVFLKISSVPVDLQADIRDIKPPMSAPWKFEDFLPFIIVTAVAGILYAGYYYYRKKKKAQQLVTEPPIPLLPPHEEALFALRDIEDEKLWQKGLIKIYYTRVTEVIRRYFERRFIFLALEMTSDEILQRLKRIEETQQIRTELRSFFTTADLVKFAKYEPSVPEHENELRWAYEIVRATVPRVRFEEEVEKEETVDVR
jgi:hypothetical protein